VGFAHHKFPNLVEKNSGPLGESNHSWCIGRRGKMWGGKRGSRLGLRCHCQKGGKKLTRGEKKGEHDMQDGAGGKESWKKERKRRVKDCFVPSRERPKPALSKKKTRKKPEDP